MPAPRKPPSDGAATLGTVKDEAQLDPTALSLRIVRDSIATMRRLPQSGKLVVGRSRTADIQIDDESISRQHARLHLGPSLAIEDLGSANGTRLRSRALARHELTDFEPGDVIELGSVMLVVQRGRVGPEPRSAPLMLQAGAMAELDAVVTRVAAGVITVLIRGETGVGKEVLAERIHGLSPRASQALVRINCATLSEALLTSELFGHERGAFTGADRTKPGLLEMAHLGTAFLDEIGELSPALQAKLLRVLEDRVVMRVGSVTPRPVDVRFIAATNRDLENDIESGRFRRDLFFRLNGFSITVPPLRERKADIEGLARAFLTEASERAARASPAKLSPSALDALMAHAWPGNVRELRNVIERAVLVCPGSTILPEHLPIELGARPTIRPPLLEKSARHAAALRDEIHDLERQRVLDALQSCGGNQTRAAKLLGVSRNTLLARLEAFGVRRPRKKT